MRRRCPVLSFGLQTDIRTTPLAELFTESAQMLYPHPLVPSGKRAPGLNARGTEAWQQSGAHFTRPLSRTVMHIEAVHHSGLPIIARRASDLWGSGCGGCSPFSAWWPPPS